MSIDLRIWHPGGNLIGVSICESCPMMPSLGVGCRWCRWRLTGGHGWQTWVCRGRQMYHGPWIAVNRTLSIPSTPDYPDISAFLCLVNRVRVRIWCIISVWLKSFLRISSTNYASQSMFNCQYSIIMLLSRPLSSLSNFVHAVKSSVRSLRDAAEKHALTPTGKSVTSTM